MDFAFSEETVASAWKLRSDVEADRELTERNSEWPGRLQISANTDPADRQFTSSAGFSRQKAGGSETKSASGWTFCGICNLFADFSPVGPIFACFCGGVSVIFRLMVHKLRIPPITQSNGR